MGEVLTKTIAMIRGSTAYQRYVKQIRARRSRGLGTDKYFQAMTLFN